MSNGRLNTGPWSKMGALQMGIGFGQVGSYGQDRVLCTWRQSSEGPS